MNDAAALSPATMADLRRVMRWVPDATACLRWAGPRVEFPLRTSRLARQIAFRTGNSYSLQDRGETVAFGQLLALRPRVVHMCRIIVAPAQRGRGYGRVLCAQLIRQARAEGVSRISLNVYRDNRPGRRLYESLGWRPRRPPVSTGRRPGLCYMVRSLRNREERDGPAAPVKPKE